MNNERSPAERFVAETNAAMAVHLGEVNQRLAKQIAELLQPTLANAAKAVQPALEQITRTVAETVYVNAEPLKRAFELYDGLSEGLSFKWLPENWRELRIGHINHLPELARRGRVSLVWVPRKEIVLEAIRASDVAACDVILVSRRAEILEDLVACLSASDRTGSDAHRDFLDTVNEAVAAAQAGLDRAAQAAAASGLGTLLEQEMGYRRLARARDEFHGEDPAKATIRRFREVCLRIASADALVQTKDNPEGFNRHGTVHVGGAWWSEANMLRALLLVVGWARELAWLAEFQPAFFEASARRSAA